MISIRSDASIPIHTYPYLSIPIHTYPYLSVVSIRSDASDLCSSPAAASRLPHSSFRGTLSPCSASSPSTASLSSATSCGTPPSRPCARFAPPRGEAGSHPSGRNVRPGVASSSITSAGGRCLALAEMRAWLLALPGITAGGCPTITASPLSSPGVPLAGGRRGAGDRPYPGHCRLASLARTCQEQRIPRRSR